MEWQEYREEVTWDEAPCRLYAVANPRQPSPWLSEDWIEVAFAVDQCMDCPVFASCAEYVRIQPSPRCGVYAGTFYNEEPWRLAKSDGRHCVDCDEWKPFSEFRFNTRDGYHIRCHPCQREQQRGWREAARQRRVQASLDKS